MVKKKTDRNSYNKGNSFEQTVLKILYHTNPYKITHHSGGRDRGRDILVTYKVGNVLYDVIVQCKYYSTSVNVSHISSSMDWAKIHRPDLLYFWVSSYLTSDTKDYIKDFSKTYEISVDYEEEDNIEQYISELDKPHSEILAALRLRIISKIKSRNALSFQENSSLFLEKNCYLQDRDAAKRVVFNEKYYAFFIQGISCCGKTQLLKYIGSIYYNKDRKIFWHTVHETNAEVQLSSFWNALSLFLSEVCQSYELQNYFKSYGYHATDILYNMALNLLNKFNLILIIDDVHKCLEDNTELIDFWIKIIAQKSCVIYFAGWFNIFESTLIIQKNLKTIMLEGMESDDLNAIIMHNTGKSMLDVAQKIEHNYEGLPGFAMLVDEETTAEDFESDDTFLFSIINYLDEDETKVLFSFVYSSAPLPLELFIKLNYERAFYSLLKRNFLIKQIHHYYIHDKYRSILLKYRISSNVYSAVIDILSINSATMESSILDIAQLYCKLGESQKAFDILNFNFERLLHKQFSLQLLDKYQVIEKHNCRDIDLKMLILKKAILLERIEKYDLCKTYLDFLEDIIEKDSTEWETIFYLKLRCLYFSNEYNLLLELVFSDINRLQYFSFRTIIQTFLLIGRIYYIRGLFSEALYFYLFAYDRALENHDAILLVKTIHRIAMIEQKLGFISECKKTFTQLLSMNDLISPKRKSYILYRIAECDYKQDKYLEAYKNNSESLRIKESIKHYRGLIFSHKLNSKISLKENNYADAEKEINVALNIAIKLNLNKEEINCFISYIELMKKLKVDLSSYHDRIKDYVKTAKDEKLLGRLYQFANLLENDYPNQSKEIESIAYNLSKELTDQFLLYQKLCDNMISSPRWHAQYETLANKKQAISKNLLFWAGLYDPIDKS